MKSKVDKSSKFLLEKIINENKSLSLNSMTCDVSKHLLNRGNVIFEHFCFKCQQLPCI